MVELEKRPRRWETRPDYVELDPWHRKSWPETIRLDCESRSVEIDSIRFEIQGRHYLGGGAIVETIIVASFQICGNDALGMFLQVQGENFLCYIVIVEFVVAECNVNIQC